MDVEKFGAFIAQARKEKNMTQADLAKELKVTVQAVSRWERGIGFPDIGTIEPLAEALDLSILELMRSEKGEMDNISAEAASKIITDSFGIAEQRVKNKKNETTVIVFSLLFVILASSSFSLSGWLNFAMMAFLMSCAAILGSGYLLWTNRADPRSKMQFGASLAISLAVWGTSGYIVLPIFSVDIFKTIELVVSFLLAFFLFGDFVCRRENRKKYKQNQSKRIGAYILMAILLWGSFSELADAGRTLNSIIRLHTGEYEAAVLQYAELILERDMDIKEDYIKEKVSTYVPESEAFYDEVVYDEGYYGRGYYSVAFSYQQPDSSKELLYGYSISIEDDLSYNIIDQGEELGEKIIKTARQNSN